MLEAIEKAGGFSETLPLPAATDREAALDAASLLLQRGWIDTAIKPRRGDGRLVAIRDIRITHQGEAALNRFRSGFRGQGTAVTNNTPLQEKKRQRFEFMRRLYELTGGSLLPTVNLNELGQHFGWDEITTRDIAMFLSNEGLVQFLSLGGDLTITHAGVVEVEAAEERPNDPTVHFPAIAHITNNIHTMTNSQIQQGTVGSTQSLVLNESQKQSIAEAVKSLRADLDQIDLEGDDREEMEAELATVESQLASSRPKTNVIVSGVKRIAELLGTAETAVGSGVEITNHIKQLHESLPGI